VSVFISAAGVQANDKYGEQFVIMFTLIMTQLKMVRNVVVHIEGFILKMWGFPVPLPRISEVIIPS
jgi:hypothetical protein